MVNDKIANLEQRAAAREARVPFGSLMLLIFLFRLVERHVSTDKSGSAPK